MISLASFLPITLRGYLSKLVEILRIELAEKQVQ